MANKKVKRVAPDIQVGSKWKCNEHDRFVAKVMAYVDGYVMFRFPHCVPGVMWWTKWVEKFTQEKQGK